ncbi:stonustoxin subunit alpha-like [Astyanax mexicanus]|uniref:stonustoxin subunit alpha-like n=1 Tax=Astyanax mexicanus TaxID=7994 RepID=UPI0020CB578A|nr:stonustoxin subunit alpha-like [Astyanax mexicanus]
MCSCSAHFIEDAWKLLPSSEYTLAIPTSQVRTHQVQESRLVFLCIGKRSGSLWFCDFTLDLNTVNPDLSLSEENRRVERREELQSYPDHPERFDEWPQVLSKERVTGVTGDTGDTGRCYWEAEWRDGGGGGVVVALSYKTISRKGLGSDCKFGWNINSWSLFCTDNRYSVLHNNNRTDLSTRPSGCRRVGVYVDCPSGTLSFYRVSSDTHSHTLTHLHTFYTTFTQPLYAGIGVYGSGSSVTLCKIE